MEIVLHPRILKYIRESREKERIVEHLKELANDPYDSRSGVDIKRLKGKKHDMYRLRVGSIRTTVSISSKMGRYGSMKHSGEEQGTGDYYRYTTFKSKIRNISTTTKKRCW